MDTLSARVSVCKEQISIHCPTCKRVIKEGDLHVTISFEEGKKTTYWLLGEKYVTSCCKELIHIPMLFGVERSLMAAYEHVVETLSDVDIDAFKKTHILKKAPRRIRNFLRGSWQLAKEEALENLTEEEMDELFEGDPMYYKMMPHVDTVGDVRH